ncbi:hypothetical protein E5Q_01116 [Mixia osmundae IAM 14324]|uniref:Uncharacterized protein n=1 Tax=Mixia osmundae (strain CBS 9802 / IAM 14324 / JCM 22182 / KY 12970) TaxID=764103 RepID=G7DV54_MIXOS|nr:hypothetical protein E5Q_01116 [Mixia osmundae IAM 14324]
MTTLSETHIVVISSVMFKLSSILLVSMAVATIAAHPHTHRSRRHHRRAFTGGSTVVINASNGQLQALPNALTSDSGVDGLSGTNSLLSGQNLKQNVVLVDSQGNAVQAQSGSTTGTTQTLDSAGDLIQTDASGNVLSLTPASSLASAGLTPVLVTMDANNNILQIISNPAASNSTSGLLATSLGNGVSSLVGTGSSLSQEESALAQQEGATSQSDTIQSIVANLQTSASVTSTTATATSAATATPTATSTSVSEIGDLVPVTTSS